MPLPVLDKTWQWNVNQAFAALGSAQADNRRILRAGIIGALKGFGSSPWTTYYSCDSSVAGVANDGVDRWAADANLVFNTPGNAHSWHVLKQTGIATNFQLCIACEGNSGNGNQLAVVGSPNAGFTGGSTTARPTATDEFIILATNSVWNNVAADVACKVHVAQATDGSAMFVFVHSSNALTSAWIIQKPKNAVTGWSNPCVGYVGSTNPTIASFFGSAKFAGYGVSAMTLFTTSESYSSSNPLTAKLINVNDLSGESPMAPIGLASETASNTGRHGELVDLWWGLTAYNEGDTFPNDTSRQFAMFGDLIVPWNGTTPLIV